MNNKNIKQLTEYGNKFFNLAREYLEMDKYFYERWEDLLNLKWGKFPKEKGWENVNWKEADDKLKKIEKIIKQFGVSLSMKNQFITLEEKYKFSPLSEREQICQDWADYAKYFYNYTMGYREKSIDGVIGYGNLVNDINNDDNYKDKFLRSVMLYNLIGRYDQINVHKSDNQMEISEIDLNLVRMEEIEKRFQQKLK